MPEGDTIFRIARRLAPLLEGERIEEAAAGGWREAVDPRPLAGCVIAAVESRGKHLLIATREGLVVHSHLGMTGSWHVAGRGGSWAKPWRQAALRLSTRRHEVVCFSPEILRIVSRQRVRREPLLDRLGPDLLAAWTANDWDDMLRRLSRYPDAPIGEAVMNQKIACGIGNVYKSEALFLAGVSPLVRVRQRPPSEWQAVYRLAQRLLRRNRGGGMRRTRFAVDGPPLWVYGRSGEPCLRCATAIVVHRQGEAARTTYWCPACQTGSDED
jgi:endonuclease-8